MCLGVPGQILNIEGEDPLLRTGQVSFGGALRRVQLAYVPEAKAGDYVIVHVGFAISIVNPKEAQRVFDYLDEIDQINSGRKRET